MRQEANYRNRLAEAFGMPDAPTLITRALQKSTMVVTELKCDQSNFGMTASIPREDAYLVALQLRACHDHDLYFDGHLIRPTNWFAGVTSIYDLRRDPVADIRDPYHCLMFYLPRKALDTMSYEAGVPRIGDLRDHPGVGIDDPVVRHLLSSLLPATARPEDAHALFLDHVALALSAHVAHVYGGMNTPSTNFADPGEQFADASDGMAGDSRQHLAQVFFWVQPIEFGRTDQAVNRRGAVPANIGTCR
jgi:hypothetical protein